MKIISVYNHKGGIAKTTTVFNLGWMLSNLGKKVLLIDCDPQCNLTGIVLGIDNYQGLFDFYQNINNDNMYSSLAATFGFEDGKGRVDVARPTKPLRPNQNLSILAGHIKFARFENILATAIKTASTLPTLKQTISAIYKLISHTGINFDIVLIDLAPSISAINQILLTSSDYFIVPTYPDFFCHQAINSLCDFLPEWVEGIGQFKNGLCLPKSNPKMLGIISGNYRVYGDDDRAGQRRMSSAFRDWANKINTTVNEKLVSTLAQMNMVISRDLFVSKIKNHSPYTLGEIPDYNALIPVSQRLSKPIFELERGDHQLWARNEVWERDDGNGGKLGVKINIEEARNVYAQLAKNILSLIE